MTDDIPASHYIYLVQLRESIRLGENIYKIGKTTQENNKRFKGYPKGSRVIFQISCDDCHLKERQLLNHFRQKYVAKPEFGAEYFEGDCNQMILDIHSCINKTLKNNIEKQVHREVQKKEEQRKKQEEQRKKQEEKIYLDNEVLNVVTSYRELCRLEKIERIVLLQLLTLEGVVQFTDHSYMRLRSHCGKEIDNQISLIEWLTERKNMYRNYVYDVDAIIADVRRYCYHRHLSFLYFNSIVREKGSCDRLFREMEEKNMDCIINKLACMSL